MIAFLIFALWIILNSRITAEVVLIGIAVSAAVYLFCIFFLGFSPKKELKIIRMAPLAIAYFAVLAAEIIKASLSVLRLVYSRKANQGGEIVEFVSPLKYGISNDLLANSITLTPGTVTVSRDGERFTVHCLRSEYAEGLDSSIFVKLLRKMEESYDG